jgi:hypothetical protein
MQYGAFGFPDPAGARLLTVPDLSQPAALHTALCSGGRRFSVQFERRQAEVAGHNGRQYSGNFDELAGDVFTVLHDKAEESTSCFLASDALLSSATLLPIEPPGGYGGCSADVPRRLAASRSRQIVNCWPIAHLPAERQFVLVEFARQGKNALASLVLIDRDRLIFADYAAVFKEEGGDLWRVGDGGVLSAEGLEAVFLLQRGDFYALGINWSAEEGCALSVFVSNGGDRFTKVLADYWYREPI